MMAMKKSKVYIFSAAVFALLLLVSSQGFAGQYVHVGGGVELYYEEAGQGEPLVFVPGWVCTTRFFGNQLDYFSKKYRTIVYDPRGQGQSSKTLVGNHYRQHGVDLKNFIDALGLKDVVLAGWSFGGVTLYSYVKQFGTDNVKALVFIDQGPKSLLTKEGDWAIGDAMGYKGFADGVNHSRQPFTEGVLKWFVSRELTKKELQWMLDEALKTPTYVAMLLITDGWFSDYSEVVPTLDVPVMNVLRKDWSEPATKYLRATLPDSKIFVLGNHAMFWEFPDQFNKAVDAFLNTLQ